MASRELLAIILNTGTRAVSALGLADALLARFGSLKALSDASVEELCALHGIGQAKAVRLAAAFELALRIGGRASCQAPLICSAEDVAGLLQSEMRALDREEFRCLLLDTKNRLIETHTVSIGHLSGALVHPREVFKAAIRRSSAALIVVHNHPSGDPTPSPEDIGVTRRLHQAGELLGIELLDHVVLGRDGFVSLRQLGYLGSEPRLLQNA